MSVLCICGVCIPYSIFWPFLLILLKPVYAALQSIFGLTPKKSAESDLKLPVGTCCAKSAATTRIFNLAKTDNWTAISKGPDLSFVRFTANWCAPCKRIEPTFLDVGILYPSCNFVSVDVDEFDEIAAQYGAFTIPMFIAIRDGQVLGRISGKDDDDLKNFVKTLAETKT
jgi:thioredoxin 1